MEIFKAVKISKDFKKVHCDECLIGKSSVGACDSKYLHECVVIDNQLTLIGSPCSHCAFITITNRKVECQVHNCEHSKKLLTL